MKEAFIFLGPECNFKCKFCYAPPSMTHLNTKDAKKEILKYLKLGFYCISFTGGEPTVRSDLIDLISFAKKSGAKKIKIQTNGFLTYNIEYLRDLKNAGLSNVYLTMESYKSKIHDYLMNKKGSFIKSIQTIKNSIKLGLELDLGFVITKVNYKDMLNFLKFINKKIPLVKNLLLLFESPSEGALDNKTIIPRYNEIELELYNTLEYAKKIKTSVFTRGIPLCYLSEHKKNSVEFLELSSGEGSMVESSSGSTKPKHSFEDTNTYLDSCDICSEKPVCGGVWKSYINLIGQDEFYPIFSHNNKKDKNHLIFERTDKKKLDIIKSLKGFHITQKIEFCNLILRKKRLVRTSVEKSNENHFLKEIDKLNLKFVTTPERLMNVKKKVWFNSGRSMNYVYISKDENIAKKGASLEMDLITTESLIQIGELFGYPSCCVESLNIHLFSQNIFPYPLLIYKKTTEHDYRLNNLFHECLIKPNFTLISHFPCTYICKESIKIAENNIRIVDFLEGSDKRKEYLQLLKRNFLYKDLHNVKVLNKKSTPNILEINESKKYKGYILIHFT